MRLGGTGGYPPPGVSVRVANKGLWLTQPVRVTSDVPSGAHRQLQGHANDVQNESHHKNSDSQKNSFNDGHTLLHEGKGREFSPLPHRREAAPRNSGDGRADLPGKSSCVLLFKSSKKQSEKQIASFVQPTVRPRPPLHRGLPAAAAERGRCAVSLHRSFSCSAPADLRRQFSSLAPRHR